MTPRQLVTAGRSEAESQIMKKRFHSNPRSPTPAVANLGLVRRMPAHLELPVTLRTSRRKMILLLITSLLFVAGGIRIASEQPLVGYSGAVFFGLGVIVFTIQLLPNSSYLHLTPEGFTFCNLFRSHTVPWHLARDFAVIRVSRRPLVVWKYSPDFAAHPKARALSRTLCGYDAALPDSYGMRPQELADLLNSLQHRYAATANA